MRRKSQLWDFVYLCMIYIVIWCYTYAICIYIYISYIYIIYIYIIYIYHIYISYIYIIYISYIYISYIYNIYIYITIHTPNWWECSSQRSSWGYTGVKPAMISILNLKQQGCTSTICFFCHLCWKSSIWVTRTSVFQIVS
jgi:hypothetical protein